MIADFQTPTYYSRFSDRLYVHCEIRVLLVTPSCVHSWILETNRNHISVELRPNNAA